MLMAIVAALSTAVPDAGGPASGAWGDIAFAYPAIYGETSSTITFTSGTPREILITHNVAIGSLSYKLGSGSFVACTSGTEFNVTTGQLVTFSYFCIGASEAATVTVTDNTLSATIDTFTCTFTA